MQFPANARAIRLAKAKIFLCLGAIAISSACAQDVNNPWPSDPYGANNRKPDALYKIDLLVVVAHPDDEIMAAAYVAREIDQGKRVAIVWTTRGGGGNNEVGPEQAAAMADIRESEGMRAAASLGVAYMWNLGGPDTPSQNPLESLETWDHGRTLERVVRIVRLTRPSVILTWLPLAVTGENHGDHQASGVIATEAFDTAGDPTAFPEQVAPAKEPRQTMNRLEGLRPWQPEKIYYFSNPSHADFFDGQGPQYSAADISSKRHISYGQIAAQEFIIHRTQGGGKVEQAIREHGMKGLERPIPLMKPSRFILGKSLVGGLVTDDVFAGIVAQGISYQRPPGFTPRTYSTPVMELGGAWSFYRQFWQAHGLDHLSTLIAPELTIQDGSTLSIPLIIENPLDSPIDVTFQTQTPEDWKLIDPPTSVSIEPHTRYFLRVRAASPAKTRSEAQQFKVSAESAGKSLGTISLRVELAGWALPQ